MIDPLDDPDDDSLLAGGDSVMTALADGNPWRDKLIPFEHLVSAESIVRPMNLKVLVEQFLDGLPHPLDAP